MNLETRNPNLEGEHAAGECPPQTHQRFEFPTSNFEFLTTVLLAIAMLLAYMPAWQCGFVSYDDPLYVTGNGHVQAGLTWAGVKWAFSTGYAGNWHPLTWLSHMLDVQLFGPGPRGPHLVNVLLHIANTTLLFLLLRRLTGARWRSAFVAALFALHPLHVESVAWIAERKDVLSALFFLLTLFFWTRGRVGRAVPCAPNQSLDKSAGSGVPALSTNATGDLANTPSTLDPRPSTLDYIAALFFFALGLMSKPMLVTLPFVLLLLDYWPLRRFAIHDSRFTRSWWHPSAIGYRLSAIAPLVREKLPFFGLSIASCVATFVVQNQGGAVQSLVDYSLGERLANAVVAYARYLGKAFWPVNLAVPYPHPGHWPAGQVGLAAVLVAGLCLVTVWWARRRPFGFTGWFWFVGMLIPTIGLVQVGDQAMADRYLYLPSIGLFVMVAWGAGECVARCSVTGVAPGVAAVAVLAGCAVLTHRQVQFWQNSESLFRHAVALTRGNFLAHNNLANALLERGAINEAITHLRMALEIKPDYADAHVNLGNALLENGMTEDALAEYRAALQIAPDFAEAHYNFANALLRQGQPDLAIAHFRQTLRCHPDHVMACNNLANALLQQGQMDDAIVQYRAAIALRPDFAAARHNLGSALMHKGETAEALAEFRALVRLQPDNANVHNNLGWMLRQSGQLDEAAAEIQQALQLQPQYAEAHANLAKTLVQQGKAPDAITHFRAAVKLHPDDPRNLSDLAWVLATARVDAVRDGSEALVLAQRANALSPREDPVLLRTLAAACAEAGKFGEAQTAAERALRAAEPSDPALAAALRNELSRYQAGMPVRD